MVQANPAANSNIIPAVHMHCYVAGKKVESQNILEVKSPFDNRVVGTVVLANASHAEAAVEAGLKGGKKLTRYDRFSILDKARQLLMERKDDFYALSYLTGATKTDSWVDIDGGIGTFFAYSSRGRREFPNECFHVEGPTEPLSKNGTFVGRHILVPIEGVAVHINAFNFPVWGMLEKLAPALLAGVPCIVKPATAGSHLAEAVFRTIVDTGILPAGAIQLVCGSAGDMLDHLEEQDVVAFTGSAATGQKLKSGAAVVKNSVRFNMEADSLNCSILGPDAVPGTEEFDLFIKEVTREMTTKAGQKCTAIRRSIVPAGLEEDVIKALSKRLASTTIGAGGLTTGLTVSGGATPGEEQRRGEDDEADDISQKQPHRHAVADRQLPVLVALVARHDGADQRHDHVVDHARDDFAEGAADDHADGEIDDVALEGKVLELLEEREGLFRGEGVGNLHALAPGNGETGAAIAG